MTLMPKQDAIDLDQACTPGLLRRLAAISYDAVLVFGVLLLLWTLYYFALAALIGEEDVGHNRLAQFYWPLALVAMVGFHVWFWSHGGQTLGMKSWRVRVATVDGGGDPACPRRCGATCGRGFPPPRWGWVSCGCCSTRST